MKNIHEGWKTTVLGIALFICGLAYVIINDTPDYIVMSILLASGVGLIFSPDRVIGFIDRKSKEV